MRGFLSRILSAMGGGAKPAVAELPPLNAQERARLLHHRRATERRLRTLEKSLKRAGCSTCIQQAPSKGLIAMERQVRALREEMAWIDHRVGSA